MMIANFQRGSATIADIRLPSSMAVGRIASGIETSNSELRSWVLLGGRKRIAARQKIWAEEIEPAMIKLQALSVDNDLVSMAELQQKMEQLKTSQWWVEDIATTVGNDPARLIYERDLLPNFERIQSAVSGLDGNSRDEADISKIRLAAAMTHQSLSEAIRQLSEAVRTGGNIEIEDFRNGFSIVQMMLTRLSGKIGSEHSNRPLLDWIVREYQVYEQLANRTIAIRQSDEWNRALHILRTETEPIATNVKNTLLSLQTGHNKLLQEGVARSALISRVGTFITLAMIIGLGLIAVGISRSKSMRLVAPIEALAKASDQLAVNEDRIIQLPVEGPREIAHLTERFNYMSRELTVRTKALQHANRELHEYTHIITHDLKPPLINIKGHAGLIKTHLQDLENTARDERISEQGVRAAVLHTIAKDIPESVGFIDLSISKMNILITGVLDNSRLLFRGVSLEEVDMNGLLEQVVALFSHRFDDVDFHCEPLPVIRTDSFLMEHIFTNLIDNALKYLDMNRTGRIEIGSEVLDGEVHFYVRDNGIGLIESTIDVFKLFKQANTASKGAGIGLALAHTMVARLGGKIWHRPNNGHGVTFRFYVPLNP